VFVFQAKTKVVFGVGVIDKLGEEAKALGIDRVLVVTDRGIKAAGLLDRALSPLRAAGVEIEAAIGARPREGLPRLRSLKGFYGTFLP